MDMNLLKAKMALHGDNQITLSQAIGISDAGLNYKLNGKSDWKRFEIEVISKRYKLTAKEIKQIFFN